MKHKPAQHGPIFSPRRRSQSGFSLVEIMIAVGVLGMITAGIVSFMNNSAKHAQSVSSKGDYNTLVNELQSIFNNAASCLAAFGGADAPVIPATLEGATPTPMPAVLKLGASADALVYQAGMKYGKGITITKFEFTKMETHTTNGQRVLKLLLEVSRKQGPQEKSFGGEILKPHEFNLIVELDGTRKLKHCAGKYENLWVRGSSSYSIAYFEGASDAKVGIGKAEPEATLDVDGITQSKQFMYKSDLRLKENVREIPDALGRVTRLHGVLFDWKRHEGAEASGQIGLIAQDVEKVFPELVSTPGPNGMKSVAYGNLVAPLIEAVKQQQRMIDEQRRELGELRQELARLRSGKN